VGVTVALTGIFRAIHRCAQRLRHSFGEFSESAGRVVTHAEGGIAGGRRPDAISLPQEASKGRRPKPGPRRTVRSKELTRTNGSPPELGPTRRLRIGTHSGKPMQAHIYTSSPWRAATSVKAHHSRRRCVLRYQMPYDKIGRPRSPIQRSQGQLNPNRPICWQQSCTRPARNNSAARSFHARLQTETPTAWVCAPCIDSRLRHPNKQQRGLVALPPICPAAKALFVHTNG